MKNSLLSLLYYKRMLIRNKGKNFQSSIWLNLQYSRQHPQKMIKMLDILRNRKAINYYSQIFIGKWFNSYWMIFTFFFSLHRMIFFNNKRKLLMASKNHTFYYIWKLILWCFFLVINVYFFILHELSFTKSINAYLHGC